MKNLLANAGDVGLIPRWERSPGEGNGTPLQYFCLESPMDRGAWQAAAYGVAKSRTQLSDFTLCRFYNQHRQAFPKHFSYIWPLLAPCALRLSWLGSFISLCPWGL